MRSGSNEATATVDRDGLYGTGVAHADYGAVSVSAFGTAAPSGTFRAIDIVAGAAMEDTFTIVIDPVPSPPPDLPRPANFSFLGAVTVTGTPTMTSFWTTIGDRTSFVTLHPGVNPIGGVFFLGQPIHIAFSVLGDTGSIDGTSRSSGSVNAGIRWEGISDVRLDNLPPSPYTVTSASGFNWALAAPVPEPPIVALLTLALAVLGARTPRQCRGD